MKRAATASLAALLLLAGCFGIEASLDLNEDLSGTAGFEFTINMEPMAYIMASLQHAFSGEEGEPSDEAVADARAELIAEMDLESEIDQDEIRRDIEEDLPEGFTLLNALASAEGLRMTFAVEVDFPHIDRLHELHLEDPDETAGEQRTGMGLSDFSSLSTPFEDLRLIDEGRTWRLEMGTPNPVEDVEQNEGMEMGFSGLETMIERAFSDLRVAMKITVPNRIVEHNATRVEGQTLYWEYTLETLQEMNPDERDDVLMVSFRKR